MKDYFINAAVRLHFNFEDLPFCADLDENTARTATERVSTVLETSGENYAYLMPGGMQEKTKETLLTRRLFAPETSSAPYSAVYLRLDECVSIIAPEMPIHFERWAELNDKKINSDSPLSADGAMRYWNERVRRMREETMVMRPYNFYGFVQEAFQLSDEDMVYYFGGPRPEKPEI